MPRGRKIMLTLVDIDTDLVREMFAKYGTKCEHPMCKDAPEPAYGVYQNGVVFMFLCHGHWAWASGLTGLPKFDWDKRANARMRELMNTLSYVHTNMNTGFALEEAVRTRNETLKEVTKLKTQEDGKIRRDLRRQIRESGVKIGSPDESLAAARAKVNDRQTGSPVKQPTPRTDGRVNLLIPRLVIGKLNTKEES